MPANVVVLIPAYNPASGLADLVRALSGNEVLGVVVIDDGSRAGDAGVFQALSAMEKTVVLRHAVNLGKGASLKTGLNYIYCQYPDAAGVVTMDADGQHLPADVLRVAARLVANPAALVIGVREFGKTVPFRSWFGNTITRTIYRVLMGGNLSDTQSGLRGIPREFIPPLLKIDSNGYEYELDMLIVCKHNGRRLVEEEIATVYMDKNSSSHFNPFLDSMKIYFVLFRFMLTSLITAGIDYSVFWVMYTQSRHLFASQAAARLISLFFNYIAVRKLVFFSEQKHLETFPKYVLLVAGFGGLSYFSIQAMTGFFQWHVVSAKIVSELLMFYANFAVQRDLIFTKKMAKPKAAA